jgi:hypothetical protein
MGHRRRSLPLLDAPQVAQHLRACTRVVHRPSPQAKLSIHQHALAEYAKIVFGQEMSAQGNLEN